MIKNILDHQSVGQDHGVLEKMERADYQFLSNRIVGPQFGATSEADELITRVPVLDTVQLVVNPNVKVGFRQQTAKVDRPLGSPDLKQSPICRVGAIVSRETSEDRFNRPGSFQDRGGVPRVVVVTLLYEIPSNASRGNP